MTEQILFDAKLNTEKQDGTVWTLLRSTKDLDRVANMMTAEGKSALDEQRSDLEEEIHLGITFAFWFQDGYLMWER